MRMVGRVFFAVIATAAMSGCDRTDPMAYDNTQVELDFAYATSDGRGGLGGFAEPDGFYVIVWGSVPDNEWLPGDTFTAAVNVGEEDWQNIGKYGGLSGVSFRVRGGARRGRFWAQSEPLEISCEGGELNFTVHPGDSEDQIGIYMSIAGQATNQLVYQTTHQYPPDTFGALTFWTLINASTGPGSPLVRDDYFHCFEDEPPGGGELPGD
jgi:hypothetical protein